MEREGVRLAITGATGFVGRGILDGVDPHVQCHGISRSPRPSWVPEAVRWSTITSYDDGDALARALDGVNYVIHLADNPARLEHHDRAKAAENIKALAYAARSSKVKGIILASSVYAREGGGDALTSYGATKRLAEEALLAIDDLPVIILRLPPIYGPGAKGGVSALTRLVGKGLPLPLGAARAPRAYMSRRNLVSLISAIASMGKAGWEQAAGKIYEPSDGLSVTTRDLVGMIAAQQGVRPRLLPVPAGLLGLLGAVTGKRELVAGAIGELRVAPVDDLYVAFAWRPIETMPESLGYIG